jgi:hypothetical protein
MIETVGYMMLGALAVIVLLILYAALDDILTENHRYDHRRYDERRDRRP